MGQSSSREAGAAAQVELQQLPVLRQGPGTRTTETRDRDPLGEPSGEPVSCFNPAAAADQKPPQAWSLSSVGQPA